MNCEIDKCELTEDCDACISCIHINGDFDLEGICMACCKIGKDYPCKRETKP